MKNFSEIKYWYHGTTSEQVASIKRGINVAHRPRPCDFGIGFYLTSNVNQARKWAQRKAKMAVKKKTDTQAAVLTFCFDNTEEFDCKEFSLDKEFFEFLYLNRIELGTRPSENLHTYDMVYGHVLDGKRDWDVVLENIKTGRTSVEKAKEQLIGQYISNDQLAICNQVIANRLILKKEEYLDVHSKIN